MHFTHDLRLGFTYIIWIDVLFSVLTDLHGKFIKSLLNMKNVTEFVVSVILNHLIVHICLQMVLLLQTIAHPRSSQKTQKVKTFASGKRTSMYLQLHTVVACFTFSAASTVLVAVWAVPVCLKNIQMHKVIQRICCKMSRGTSQGFVSLLNYFLGSGGQL